MSFSWLPWRRRRSAKRTGRRTSVAVRPQLEALESRITPTQVLTSFRALNATDGGLVSPPDPQAVVTPPGVTPSGDPVPAAYWESVNLRIRARRLSDDMVTFSEPVQEFFGAPTLQNGTLPNGATFSVTYSDTRLSWDELSNRLFIAAIEVGYNTSVTPPFKATRLHLAVSKTATPQHDNDFDQVVTDLGTQVLPAGNSYVYNWGDFPSIGWNRDFYAITLNLFSQPFTNFLTGVFRQVRVLTVEKATIAAAPVFHVTDRPGSDGSTFAPARMRGSGPNDPMLYAQSPLAGESFTTTQPLRIWSQRHPKQDPSPISDDFAPSSFTPKPSFDPKTNANPYVATQPGGSQLDAGDNRIGSPPLAAPLDQSGVKWSILLTHTVRRLATPTQASTLGVRWFEVITTLSTAPTTSIRQQADVVPVQQDSSTYYPSIDQTTNGNLYLTFMESGSGETMSTYVAGRRQGEPLSTLQEIHLVEPGTGSYLGATNEGTPYRTGDFSSVTVDGRNNGTVWIANEYAYNGDRPNWSTTVAQVAIGDNERIVRQLYRDLLRREPSQGDAQYVAGYVQLLNTGTSIGALAYNKFLTSTEYRTYLINDYYARYLLRDADSGGLQFWGTFLSNPSNTVEQFRAKILGSTEYFMQTHAFASNDAFVAQVYTDVLYRGSSMTERSYWVGQLNNSVSRENVALGIVRSTEGYQRLLNHGTGLQPPNVLYQRPQASTGPLVPGLYQQILRRTPDPSEPTVYVTALVNGTSTDAGVIQVLVGSLEYQNAVARLLQ